MNRIDYIACPDDEGMLLKDVIARRMQVSKRLVKRLKAHPKGILVNGERRTVRYVVHAADHISLAMAPRQTETDVIHEAAPLSVIYEDELLLVVDKPPGITMFPRHRGEKGSLAGRVLAHLEGRGEACHFHPVSRLDIGTSGLVLLAKNSYVADWFSRHRPQKCYQCFSFGHIDRNMHLTANIAECSEQVRHAVGPLFYAAREGKACSTHIKPLYYDEDLRATALWIWLETGRRHQIRVHLAHQGHPLVGDVSYGGPAMVCGRPLLHAAALSYLHPQSREKLHHFLPMHVYDTEPQIFNNDRLFVDYTEMR